MRKNKVVLINILSTVLLHGSMIFTTPIFSRLLGTDNYGVVSVFNTWAAIIAIVFPACVSHTIGMSVSEYNENERKRYQSSIYYLGLVSFALFSAVCVMFIKPIAFWLHEDEWFVILLLLTALGNYCTEFATRKNIFEFRPHYNLALSLTLLIGYIGLGLPLVYLMKPEINYYGKIISYAATSLLCSFIVSIGVFKEGKTLYNRKYWEFCMPLCMPLVLQSLSNIVLSQSDRVMLQSLKGNGTAGIYSLAYRFGGVLVSVHSVLNNSWIPFYYNYIREGDSEKLKNSARQYLDFCTGIYCGFLLIYPEIFTVFASSDYWAGIQIMPMLIASFFFVFLYGFSIHYETYYKKTRAMAVITVSAAIINILMNCIMIEWFDIFGAALATAISYFYEFVIHFLYVRVVLTEQCPFRMDFYIKPMLSFLVANIFFGIFFQNYAARWGLAIVLGIALLVRIVKGKSLF